MFAAKDTLLTRPSGGYQISRSLRFNSADSTYLTRTPATATNRRTWTWSAWVKRSTLGTIQELFDSYFANTDSGYFWVGFTNGVDALEIQLYNTTLRTTTQVFRDPSAWYHIVLAVDTTQATAANRVKVYLNGSEITAFSTNNAPTQNLDTAVNYNGAHYIGTFTGTTNLFNGYITEVNLIDGQALTPSSFGETNAQTGVWQPKAFSGTYGTNGFYLNFSDNSNTTAATLGKDYSGNGNNWTPNNFSVTAGVGNDSMVDVPTSYGTDTGVGGEVRGNYCTLNPLTTTTGTYSQANLRYVGANQDKRPTGTISVSTGQWYWEVTLANAPYSPRATNSGYNAFGFVLSTVFNSTTSPPVSTDALVLEDNGYYKNFSGAFTDGGVAFLSGDVLSVAVDLGANTFTFRRNNTSLATGTIGGTAGRELVPFIFSYNGDYGVMDCNFGQRPFAYTAPSGFKALCTQNLPTPTIGATSATLANTFFTPVTYTGTGATQSITTGFQPDFVWIKSRSSAYHHFLFDSVRGINNFLYSDLTNAAYTDANALTSLNPTGFTLGFTANADTNNSGGSLVAWNWRASNATAVSNTAGSITSTVSASTTSGFSVVTYTGNGIANATFGHGLGVFPSFVIVKNRNGTGQWRVWAKAYNGGNGYGILDQTNAFTSDDGTLWGSYPTYTGPTSSVITVSASGEVNGSTKTYVAYCFTAIAGYSAFGTYTGNGSADGPFVYTGFRPAYVMIKRTTSAYDWWLLDVARGTINAVKGRLYANAADAESTTYPYLDFLSNGFKLRDADGGLNASGEPYIYMCFASNPFKYSLAR